MTENTLLNFCSLGAVRLYNFVMNCQGRRFCAYASARVSAMLEAYSGRSKLGRSKLGRTERKEGEVRLSPDKSELKKIEYGQERL